MVVFIIPITFIVFGAMIGYVFSSGSIIGIIIGGFVGAVPATEFLFRGRAISDDG
jgi:hypothetical protein